MFKTGEQFNNRQNQLNRRRNEADKENYIFSNPKIALTEVSSGAGFSNFHRVPTSEFDKENSSLSSEEINYKSINIKLKELKRSGDLKHSRTRDPNFDQVFDNITSKTLNSQIFQTRSKESSYDLRPSRSNALTPINTESSLNKIKKRNFIDDEKVNQILERSQEYLKINQERVSLSSNQIVSDRYRKLDSAKRFLTMASPHRNKENEGKENKMEWRQLGVSERGSKGAEVKLSPRVITPVKKSKFNLNDEKKKRIIESPGKYTVTIKSTNTPVKISRNFMKENEKSGNKKKSEKNNILLELDNNSRIYKTRELGEEYTLEDLIRLDYKPIKQSPSPSGHKFNYDSKITPIKHNKVDVSFSTPGTISPLNTDKKYATRDKILTSRVRVDANTPHKYSDNNSEVKVTPVRHNTREVKFQRSKLMTSQIRRNSLEFDFSTHSELKIQNYPLTSRNEYNHVKKVHFEDKRVHFSTKKNEFQKPISKTRVVTPRKNPGFGRYRMSFDVNNTRKNSFKIEDWSLRNVNMIKSSNNPLKSHTYSHLSNKQAKSFNTPSKVREIKTPTSGYYTKSPQTYNISNFKASPISSYAVASSRIVTNAGTPRNFTFESKKTQETILFKEGKKVEVIMRMLDEFDVNGLLSSVSMASILSRFFNFFSNGRATKNDILNFTNKFTKVGGCYVVRKDVQDYLIKKVT